jgi:hypothetical protein
MQKIHWQLSSIAMACVLTTTSQVTGARQLFKCKSEGGQITFSDRDCPVSKKEAARRPVPTVESLNMKARGNVEKLTTANVQELIQKANATVATGDHKAQCALLAPDLLFTISDSSSSPPTSMSGGRAKLCNFMQQSANMLRMTAITGTSTLGKIDVKLIEDGQLATAGYTTLQTISAPGKPSFTVRCEQDDQLGLYDGNILFNRSRASCKPEQ